jgi:hypothetical protein
MTFLEAGDVARALDVTPATVRVMARDGRLRVAATTARGGRLFLATDVEPLRWARRRASTARHQLCARREGQ